MANLKPLVLNLKSDMPRHYIDQTLIDLSSKRGEIEFWESTTNLFKRTRDLVRNLLQKVITLSTAFDEIREIR